MWLAALAASWWINLQILTGRAGYVDLQGADAVALAALALFTAMLFLAGPKPAARPMRSRDLLLAKALTLGLTAVLPFALTHWATVALRGFPLGEHALELTWSAELMVSTCAAPIAALASVSRNLQSVVLMLLAGLVVAYGPYVRYSPDRSWGQEATVLWIVLAGSAGVLCLPAPPPTGPAPGGRSCEEPPATRANGTSWTATCPLDGKDGSSDSCLAGPGRRSSPKSRTSARPESNTSYRVRRAPTCPEWAGVAPPPRPRLAWIAST